MLGMFAYDNYQESRTECCPSCGKWNFLPYRLVDRDMVYFGQRLAWRPATRTVFGQVFETEQADFYDRYATFIQCLKCRHRYYVIYEFLYVND